MMQGRFIRTLCLIASLAFGLNTYAQDELLDMLESEETEATDYAFATFKTTRIINGHSIETNSKGVLQFIIAHRFGRLNSGCFS